MTNQNHDPLLRAHAERLRGYASLLAAVAERPEVYPLAYVLREAEALVRVSREVRDRLRTRVENRSGYPMDAAGAGQ